MSTVVVAVRACVITLLLTGLLYPLAVTGLARVLLPERAEGSFVRDGTGRVVGSELIGQKFRRPEYFQPRPSAAGEGYDATASGGSNLAPSSRKLVDRATAEAARLGAENPDAPGPIPAELVAASASGLDPHISPAAATWQIPRVARARGVSLERVRALIDDQIEERELGVLGEPRVNVLMLNLAADRLFGVPSQTGAL